MRTGGSQLQRLTMMCCAMQLLCQTTTKIADAAATSGKISTLSCNVTSNDHEQHPVASTAAAGAADIKSASSSTLLMKSQRMKRFAEEDDSAETTGETEAQRRSPRVLRTAGDGKRQQQQQHLKSNEAFNIPPSYRTPVKYCYQCAYSPPKTYQQKEGKSRSKSSKMANEGLRPGGWEKCLGPFDETQAAEFGVDVWQCHSNCYTRRDPNGDIFRGCYKGEYGVDPSRDGCHSQAGSIYCFCDGDRCNSGSAPNS